MTDQEKAIRLLMDELNWAYQGLATLGIPHPARVAYDFAARTIALPGSNVCPASAGAIRPDPKKRNPLSENEESL